MKNNAYVATLPERQQKILAIKLAIHLYREGLRNRDLENAVQDGLDSRICDLPIN